MLKLYRSVLLPLTVGAGITLAITFSSGSIEFIDASDPYRRDEPVTGWLAWVVLQQFRQRVISEQQQIQEKLSLGSTRNRLQHDWLRDIQRGFNSTYDSRAKR